MKTVSSRPLIFFLPAFLLLLSTALSGANSILPSKKRYSPGEAFPGFIINKGQFGPAENIFYRLEGSGVEAYITSRGLSFVFQRIEPKETLSGASTMAGQAEYSRIDLTPEGGSISGSRIFAEEMSAAGLNYYLPGHPEGITGVRSYRKIIVKDLYPGIDWVFYANGGNKGFEHDFIVHPGADPGRIRLVYTGDSTLQVKAHSNRLRISNRMGQIEEGELKCYTEDPDKKVKAGYVLEKLPSGKSNVSQTKISFTLERYDPSRTLVIDPFLVWGTYYGAEGQDLCKKITTDNMDNVFVLGETSSLLLAAIHLKDPGNGEYYQAFNGNGAVPVPLSSDLFILKFDPDGVLLWGTYYGGAAIEFARDLAVGPNGNVYVMGHGSTFSSYDPGGGAYYLPTGTSFILEFDNNGVRKWATGFGIPGVGSSSIYACAVDRLGNLYITGSCGASIVGVPPPGYNPLLNGPGYFQYPKIGGGQAMFIARFNPARILEWHTPVYGNARVGSTPLSMACDKDNSVYISAMVGDTNLPVKSPGPASFSQALPRGSSDFYIIKFDNTARLVWATYLGGPSFEGQSCIAVDRNLDLYFAGLSGSGTLPVVSPGGSAYSEAYTSGNACYIARFDKDLKIKWSTYYRGSSPIVLPYGLTLDRNLSLYITGSTGPGMPLTDPGNCAYFDSTTSPLGADAFLIRFNPYGAVSWATHIGSSAYGTSVSVDASENIYVCGTFSFPLIRSTANPGGGAFYQPVFGGGISDGFILKFAKTAPDYTLADSVKHVCPGSSGGSATIHPQGGASPYKFLWSTSPPQTGQTATGLATGTYTVTVTDVNCVVVVDTVTVQTASGVFVSTSAVNALICGTPTGSAAANPTGGAPGPLGYMYVWNTVPVQVTKTATALINGNYNVTVTDGNGCTASADVYVNCDLSVPLRLVRFTAERRNTSALLMWQTASENATESFEIQRSSDGAHFETTGSVRAAGFSNTLLTYSYLDPAPFKKEGGVMYYRLQLKDAGGSAGFSSVREVRYIPSAGLQYGPSPLQAGREFFISLDCAREEEVRIKVYSLFGPVVMDLVRTPDPGDHRILIPSDKLDPGVYIIEVASATLKENIRLVVR